MRVLSHSSRWSAKALSLLAGMGLSIGVLSVAPGAAFPASKALVSSTPALAQPVPTLAPPSTGPDKRSIAAYLAREWKLEHTYAAEVASAVVASSTKHQVDPVLLLAVAATESSLQHSVGNPGGGSDPRKPYGIMQVAGQYHVEKFPGGVVRRTSVDENVDIGAQVLKEYLTIEDGNERRALLRYNGSLKISDKYFQKVNSFKQKILARVKEFRHTENS